MTRRGRWAGALAPLFGAALLAAHAAALPRLIDWAERPELVVRVRAPWRAGDGVLAVDGALPAELAGRATVAIDGEVRGGAGDLPEIARTAAGGAPHAPGMHRIEWRVAYRGGALRRVGWTQLSGPYQDVARPPCSVRV
ncbi:MAG TPA: hypothetical protein VKZ63_18795, partial [Kofleriaceae bacterium]|nr:hypothetical protein [Kofleriaceae bacterium]